MTAALIILGILLAAALAFLVGLALLRLLDRMCPPDDPRHGWPADGS